MVFSTPPNEWTKIVSTGYVVKCCGCGIEHVLDIRNDPDVPGEFEIRITRDADLIKLAKVQHDQRS
jgi:hypothetical protein